MKEAAAQLAYDFVGAVALGLALPWLWCRGSSDGLAERLGRVALPSAGFSQAPIWLHAASVGETRAVLPLVEALRRLDPEVPWIVSNTTVTGRAVARREIEPAVSTLLPVDSWRVVDRVFARTRPRGLIVVENELWPGLLRAAQRVGATAVLVSARMSPRTLRRSLWVKPLFGAALGRFAAICAQSEDDAARLRELGAPAERVHVTGNLKAARPEAGGAPTALDVGGRVVLVAASTQPEEEAFVLDACEKVWAEYPQVLLVLAPRRPERFDEVARLLERRGVSFERRSASETAVAAHSKCLFLDTLGELTSLLPLARGCFVGGTVAPIGGHNVLEPATAGVAVSFGPHLDNVRASAEALCSAAAAVRVADAGELADHWRELVGQPERAKEMGERARAVATDLAGAVPATVAVIAPLLGFAP